MKLGSPRAFQVREAIYSDLCLYRVTLVALLRIDWRRARGEGRICCINLGKISGCSWARVEAVKVVRSGKILVICRNLS